MKKLLQYGMFLISFFFLFGKVSASSEFLLENDPNGLTYHIVKPDRTMRLYFMLVRDKETKELLYCLDPGVQLSSMPYEELEEWEYEKVGLSSSLKDYIERVAYFGYGYQNQWDLNYYYAAQMLIWEAVLPDEYRISFTNGLGGEEVFLFQYERNQILEHLKQDEVSVSFDGKLYEWNGAQEFVLEDDNKVLKDYALMENIDGITRKENQLIVSEGFLGEAFVEFQKIYEGNPIKFYNISVGQKLMRRGKLPVKKGTVFLNPYYLNLEVLKVSNDQDPISGVIFEIRAAADVFLANGERIYQKNDLVREVTTNENGMIVLENMLDGEYYLKEISAPFPYEISKDPFYFSLNSEHLTEKFVITNEYQKQKLLLLKEDETFQTPLAEVRFQIWNEEGKCIFDGYTDFEGKIVLDKLSVGTYKIVEVETVNGYELLHEPIIVTLDGIEDVFRVVIKNRKIERVPDTLEEKSEGILLNYRTNVMYDFSYQFENISKNFTIYTDNLTNHFLYLLHPLKAPSYYNAYLEESDVFDSLPEDVQNKISIYMRMTEEETNLYTQMLYYINTQILIWNSLYSGLEIMGNISVILDYEKQMLEKIFVPDWIHDYEFSQSMILLHDPNFTISSTCGKITDEGYDLSNCDGTTEIMVVENVSNACIFYVFQEDHFVLSGNRPRTFHFLVKKSEEVLEEEEEEILDSTLDSSESSLIKISNVPNTYESVSWCSYFLWILLCFEFYFAMQN